MNVSEIEENIKDIRYFQRYEMHEEALAIANKISMESLSEITKCKLYKLMCLSYRKLEMTEQALICINHAINCAKAENDKKEDNNSKKELGICMMNKGVVYDADKDYKRACEIYKQAISIFKSINEIEDGILVNALINYGDALSNIEMKSKALFIYREALSILDEKKDARYNYLVSKIEVIEKNIREDY